MSMGGYHLFTSNEAPEIVYICCLKVSTSHFAHFFESFYYFTENVPTSVILWTLTVKPNRFFIHFVFATFGTGDLIFKTFSPFLTLLTLYLASPLCLPLERWWSTTLCLISALTSKPTLRKLGISKSTCLLPHIYHQLNQKCGITALPASSSNQVF